MLAPWKKHYNQSRQHITKQRHHFANKGPSSQSYGFSTGHAWMWELDYKESWVPNNWCFWTVVLEKSLESHLDSKEIKPVNPKGNQLWIFIARTDAEAEAPILWPPDAKNWLPWRRPWCWERLKAGGEGGDRGWDGWMASLTQWTWVSTKAVKKWRIGKPGVLQSMGSQTVWHDLAAEQQWQQQAIILHVSVNAVKQTDQPGPSGRGWGLPGTEGGKHVTAFSGHGLCCAETGC